MKAFLSNGLNKLVVISKKYCNMKQIFLFLSLSTLQLFFPACKKDGSKVNITLHDKSLSTIQSNIAGKWDLKYIYGGFSPRTYKQNNFFWTFTSDNKLIVSHNDTIAAETSITWVREHGLFIGPNDLTYIMTPLNYVAVGIFNDTLVIHDNSYEAMYYHLIKVK